MATGGARRRWVYTAPTQGFFTRLHRISGVILQLILFGTPWLSVGGRPALRIDIPGRRVFTFGAVFGATDTILLVLILLFLAFLLFFVTSLFGRAWCGFLCPQTVFLLEWVRRIEAKIEGTRGKRMKRDQGPWVWDKIWRKAAKWTAFAALSMVVALTFVSYFSDPVLIWTGRAGSTAYWFVAFFAVIMMIDFAWFREQFCIFLCPYARFQGALTDQHSLVVGYDSKRGEPRRGVGDGSGLCISCNKCVVVCPAGIDIRDGFQLDCISCALCVDACEEMMQKKGTGPTLIPYTTPAALEGEKPRLLRPRTVAYGALLSALTIAFVVLLGEHHYLDASINRMPGTLYSIDDDGWTRNTFLLRITNNWPDPSTEAAPIQISLVDMEQAELTVSDVAVASTQTITVPLVVRTPPDAEMKRTHPFRVRVKSGFDDVVLDQTFKTGSELVTP